MTIAEIIRQYLQSHPEGAITNDIYGYCKRRGAPFKVREEQKRKKSVSG